MKLRVRFRFNKDTGEVEEMLISDDGDTPPEADHDRRHDARANEIGRIVSRLPSIREELPGIRRDIEQPEPTSDVEQTERDRKGPLRDRQKQ